MLAVGERVFPHRSATLRMRGTTRKLPELVEHARVVGFGHRQFQSKHPIGRRPEFPQSLLQCFRRVYLIHPAQVKSLRGVEPLLGLSGDPRGGKRLAQQGTAGTLAEPNDVGEDGSHSVFVRALTLSRHPTKTYHYRHNITRRLW